MAERPQNPNAYLIHNLGGVADFRTNIAPGNQERIRALQANRPAATLFTFATWHAFYRKHGGNTLLSKALADETGKSLTNQPKDPTPETTAP